MFQALVPEPGLYAFCSVFKATRRKLSEKRRFTAFAAACSRLPPERARSATDTPVRAVSCPVPSR